VLSSQNAVREKIEKMFELFPRLAERRKQLGSTLSGGEQQMLGVARRFDVQPAHAFAGRTSLGLAPVIVNRIFEIIQRISREGMTILLVEQNAHEALHVSHRGYVLETGSILLSGPAAELLRDQRVIEAYLGV